MKTQSTATSFGFHFAQIAWVVPDVHTSEKLFTEVFGISNFMKLENISSKENEGRCNGESDDYIFHLYMALSGDTLIELIQPVSGESMFQKYLEKNPQGGVQHIAYMLPESDLDTAVSELTSKGYPIVHSLHLPVANVVFFNTEKEIGVATEIIGLTQAEFN